MIALAEQRLAKLRAIMSAAGIDMVALIPGANLRYLSGGDHYSGERPIVLFIPLDQEPLAIIPRLEVPLFSADPLRPRILAWTDAEGYERAFEQGLDTLQPAGKLIGVEGLYLRFFEGELIRRHAPKAEVVAVDTPLARLRLIKDEHEIAALRRAVAISEEALRQTLAAARRGMSEIELGHLLDAHMLALGSEEPAFKTILHGGANTALPHSGPLPYRLAAGDPLLIDFGAVYQGYRADLTRVVFMGQPDRATVAFYNVVQQANARARAIAGPGVAAEAVDNAAREVLIGAGYEHLIRHRTGHGIGLQAHEAPFIVQGNRAALEPGMVFTVEPGIYEMGRLGVRVEDDLLVTATGAESLSEFSRDIVVIEPA